MYKNTNALLVLLYADQLFSCFNTTETTFKHVQLTPTLTLKIWQARYYMIRDQILSSNTFKLQDKALGLYNEFLAKTDVEDKQILAMIWLERIRVSYKHSLIEEALEKAKQLLGLKINLTGKLGRRTKYQKFDIPQLVLDIETESVDFVHPEVSPIDEIIAKEDSDQESEIGIHEEEKIEQDSDLKKPKISHTNVNLDNESILLEKVKLKNDETSSDVSLPEQIYLNAAATDQLINYMDEYDLKYETVNAYIQKAMEKSNNWLIFSMSLLLRSRNEKDKLKTRERCMIQMQILIDQFRDESPCVAERIKY